MVKITPLILCGGLGARLWPVSHHARPKPFLPLAGDLSLMGQTLARFKNNDRFGAPVIMANVKSRLFVERSLKEAGVRAQKIILEPASRGTAPAIAAAALMMAHKTDHDLILAAPSDHVIADIAAFYDAIDRAALAARHGYIAAFGVRPSSAGTGYGYIEKGAAIENMTGISAIKSFIEKPSADMAKNCIETDRFLWNAGIFLFRADVILDLFQTLAPHILKAAELALDEGNSDSGFFQLGGAFAAAPDEAFDTAIMEKIARSSNSNSNKSVVAPVDMGWHDVGSWRALWDIADKDQKGNAIIGAGRSLDSQNCLIYSDDGRPVFALGVDNLAIISAGDGVLVVNKNDSERVALLKKFLPETE